MIFLSFISGGGLLLPLVGTCGAFSLTKSHFYLHMSKIIRNFAIEKVYKIDIIYATV